MLLKLTTVLSVVAAIVFLHVFMREFAYAQFVSGLEVIIFVLLLVATVSGVVALCNWKRDKNKKRSILFNVGFIIAFICAVPYTLMLGYGWCVSMAQGNFRWDWRPFPVQIASTLNAEVGVAAVKLDSLEVYLLGDGVQYPMQSVYKFPLALSILKRVDEGKLNPNQICKVLPEHLLPDTWSPLRDKFPHGGDFTLRELLRYSMQESDNNACDYLFALVGGPQAVQNDLDEWKIKGIRICSTEAEIRKTPSLQYANSCSPSAMTELLQSFDAGAILQPETTELLWNMMATCQTGKTRLMGELSSDYVVAHKTGSGMVKDGIATAVNDVGIIVLPDGRKLAVSIFIKDAKATPAECEAVIAKITKWLCEQWANGKTL